MDSAICNERTLGAVLSDRGLDPCRIVATYNDLNPLDRCDDFRSIADVMKANVHHILDRMHDGAPIADDSPVLSFVALGNRKALLTAFRRFRLRRPGIVPGDIVYDYDAAPLLHAFITRADHPHFYDVMDEAGMNDVIDNLIIEWPDDNASPVMMADCIHLRVTR